jgi:hypothetical protein
VEGVLASCTEIACQLLDTSPLFAKVRCGGSHLMVTVLVGVTMPVVVFLCLDGQSRKLAGV